VNLAEAINSNDPKKVAAAIAAGEDVNKPVLGHAPLFKAVAEAKPDIVDLLLAHGADPNKRDRSTGWTPLMMASINCHKSARRHFPVRAVKDSRRIVRSLLDAGAADPETDYIMGNAADEAALVAAAARLKPRAQAEILDLDGAVVLVPPRMKKRLDVGFPYLDTIGKFAAQRRLTRLQAALAP
jgi:ankyrin repeat protein